MNRIGRMAVIVSAIICAGVASVWAQSDATAKSRSGQSIPYSHLQEIFSGDTDATIAEKAAKVLPRPNQSPSVALRFAEIS